MIDIYDIYLSLERSLNFFLRALPYLMLGFILSTYLKIKLKGDLRKKFVHVLDGSKKSIVLASFIGAILPLCSASGIPVASAMNSKGANLGVSFAFMVSASSINPIGILLTISLLGYKMVIVQVLASIVLSIFVGFIFYNEKAIFCGFETKNHNNSFFSAFIEQFRKLFPSIVLGFLISGFIMTYVPKETILLVLSNNVYTYFYVSIIRIFIFLCPYAMLPIIKTVAIEGIPKGLIVSFLISAPTLGLPILLPMKKYFGNRLTLKYVFGVVVGSGIIGITLDKIGV
ncbi:permease [Methanotorris igneus]|uniref:Permease n=1 Tax=Methanotorris igneus (strain DSM 5666 / JCM 11834 / Kol 5) TaxID=880724 RepID=F6BDN3_METIK|nr:permease [Methanotorris igneus]AEF96594.1 Protein of unknown function DUF318, transmembrane [Methanotorris igneus Kol 5]